MSNPFYFLQHFQCKTIFFLNLNYINNIGRIILPLSITEQNNYFPTSYIDQSAYRDIWDVLPPKPGFQCAQCPRISRLTRKRDVSSIFAPSSKPQQPMRDVISTIRQALIVWSGSKHKLVACISSTESWLQKHLRCLVRKQLVTDLWD